MRYALTGATGFLGGALAAQLRRDGHDVAALVRNPAKADRLSQLGAELVSGDLSNAPALDRLCDGADGFFHVAGWFKVGDRHPEEGWRVNVEGTRNALTAAQRTGVPRIVYTSTCAINSDTRGAVVDEAYRFTGRHLSVYDETKAAAHDLAHELAERGAPIVTVMPGLIYGPGDTSQTGAMMAQVARGKRVLVAKGGGLSWTYVDDVAHGHLLAMTSGQLGTAYIMAGPRETLADVLRRVAALARTKPPVALSDAAVATMAKAAGLLGRFAPLAGNYAAESMRAALATYYGDASKAERELGWTTRDLDAGLAETVRSLRA